MRIAVLASSDSWYLRDLRRVQHRLAELGHKLSTAELEKTYQRFLAVADQRKEVTDEELESLVADELRVAQELYHLDYLNVVSGGTTIPTATIRLRSHFVRASADKEDGCAGFGFEDLVNITNFR